MAAGGIGTEAIVKDAWLRATAERAMREVVAAGNADLGAIGSAARLDEPEIVQRMFMLTDTMGDYHTSMAIDYVLARPLEVEMILGNPLRRAGELGIAAPTVTALYALVRAADRRNQGMLPVITPDRV